MGEPAYSVHRLTRDNRVQGAEAHMSEKATIKIRANGSMQVTGATIIGADGNVIAEDEAVFLCRCGHSENKPFCDGAHRAAGFTDDGCHAPVTQ